MWKNNRGAALMQVLLVAMIISGIAVMLLRAGLSRASSARRTRRIVSADMAIESCMAEVNAMWASKTPEAFNADLGIRTVQQEVLGAEPVSYTGPLIFQARLETEKEPHTGYSCRDGQYSVHVYWWKDPSAAAAEAPGSGEPENGMNSGWRLVYEVHDVGTVSESGGGGLMH